MTLQSGEVKREAADRLNLEISQGQSVLLLGPRQVGKTTLIRMVTRERSNLMMLNMLRSRDRDRFSIDPDRLIDEVVARLNSADDSPVILVIDEVQRVPPLLDAVQLLLDEYKGRVICLLSGSSARKLKRGQVNLLPGRLTQHLIFPLNTTERQRVRWSLADACRFGQLPGIVTAASDDLRRRTLEAYVGTYLQEEIREEGLVRNYGAFRSFLQHAAESSGSEVRFETLSQKTGVTANTIKNYYSILLDTLTAFEVPPINVVQSLPGRSPRRLSKTPKIYLFDPGIINGILQRYSPVSAEKGRLVEHLVLVDLRVWLEQNEPGAKLGHWRQHQGYEVDFVISDARGLTGIEVKLSTQPGKRDLRGLCELHRVHGLRRAMLVCDVARPTDLGRTWRTLRPDLEPPDLVVALPFADLHRSLSA